MRISFFVPCFNEAGNVAGTLDTILSVMKTRDHSFEILVVDDGSTDRTTDAIKNYQILHKEAPVFAHLNPRNCGLGRNYIRFTELARGEYYMLIYGDNSMLGGDIATIVDQLGKADMVVPYVANQNERELYRNILSRLFNCLVGIVSGNKLRYYNGPVLHLRENVVRFRPKASGFAYQAEILCRALRGGRSFIEVPLYYVKSKHNRSSAFRIANVLSVLRSLGRIFLDRILRAEENNRIPKYTPSVISEQKEFKEQKNFNAEV